jgi:hypothetical protein
VYLGASKGLNPNVQTNLMNFQNDSKLLRKNQFARGNEKIKHDRGNDELRKAKYLFKVRPKYLWLATPRRQQSFRIMYFSSGFSLEPVTDIPAGQ